jgi:transcriptional regulator with XRE-family HTH domain
MKTKYSAKLIGSRIAKLRKAKGMSQNDLAQAIKVSRPVIAQIEMGNRGIDILEIPQIIEALACQMTDLFVDQKEELVLNEEFIEYKAKENLLRNPIPHFQLKKFKHTLLFLLKLTSGNPNFTERALHSLLYFCDFNYYEKFEDHLSGLQYSKTVSGPIAEKLDHYIQLFIEEQIIQRVKISADGKKLMKLIPLIAVDLRELNGAEMDTIHNAVIQFDYWTVDKLKSHALADKPLKVTSINEVISYELAFYRTPEYSVRDYSELENED